MDQHLNRRKFAIHRNEVNRLTKIKNKMEDRLDQHLSDTKQIS